MASYTFNETKEYDNVLLFCAASNQEAGLFMERTKKFENWEAVYTDLENHSNLRNVKEGAGNHMITKGAIKIIYTWKEDEDITQEDLDNFWNLAKENAFGVNIELIESNAENRQMIFNASFENNSNAWVGYPLPYTLDCSGVRQEILEDGTDIFCYVFKENDQENWTKQHCNIASGETFTITKEGNEYCYVVFGEAVETNAKTLEALKPYRLTNESIEVTNNSNNSCKIFRTYK
jgi:hypothetical protein